jgi:hypothetical protein
MGEDDDAVDDPVLGDADDAPVPLQLVPGLVSVVAGSGVHAAVLPLNGR